MIEKHLGETIDIHGGGQDLIFPHHENEIAQGTCAHDGALYCKTWVHNGFVRIQGQKMSKSLNNILLVKDLLSETCGEVIRLALLSIHYRQPLDWNQERIQYASRFLLKAYQALDLFCDISIDPKTSFLPEVEHALCQDLNTSLALSVLGQCVEKLSASSSKNEAAFLKGQLLLSASLLGLLQDDPKEALAKINKNKIKKLSPEKIEALIQERNQARAEKNYKKSDEIRDFLTNNNVSIRDHNTGTDWVYV